MIQYRLFSFFVLAMIRLSFSATVEDRRRLHDNLFRNYNRNIRPVLDDTKPVIVSIEHQLTSINEVNEKGQYLKTTWWFDIDWKDELLVWNSTEYGGVTKIAIPPTKIWLPDVYITRTLENSKDIGGSGVNAIIYNDGSVTWWPGKDYITACKVDITHYPFDIQACSVNVSTWYSQDPEILLNNMAATISLYHYEENGEWNILKTAVVKRHDDAWNQTIIQGNLTLQRRSAFYVLNIIFPIVVLSLLNVVCFVVMPQSGEKLNLCISVFLTFAVFLTVITSSMPEASDHTSILSVYLTIQLFISGFIIIMNILIIRLHHRQSNQEVPVTLIKLAGIIISRNRGEGRTVQLERAPEGQQTTNKENFDLNQKTCANLNLRPESNPNICWVDVASALDKLLFWLFLCLSILLSVAFIISITQVNVRIE